MLSFCLFACFSSDGQGWVRRWSCLLMVRFVFLFCLLFRWGVLHRVLLVIGWCQVWYYSGFLCVSSHYLILPRVSSLVVQGLGVSAPTPKAQGLISYQEWRFHKWFVMALPAQVGCMSQVLGPGALGRPRGIGWRGRWEGGSGWEIHVYPWLIHANVWQKPL